MLDRRSLVRRVAPVLIASLLSAVACLGDERGRLSALETGALLDPPAARLPTPEAPCGPAGPVDPSVRRTPYVQDVDASGGAVVWTADATAPGRLIWTDLDGTPRGVVVPEREPSEYLRDATQYVARVEGLEPGERVCYALETDDGRRLFGPLALRAAPAPRADGPIGLIVFGDSGGATDDQRALAAQMATVPADLMLHTGDVAYYDGTLPQLEAGYFEVYAPLIRSVPMFPASGNHDYHTDDAAPFREVFVLPDDAPEPERWYSFDWGPLHVAVLDSERDGDTQAAWLRRDLEASDRPWTIVTAHQGPYSSGSHGGSDGFRDRYQPILEAHGVQLVLTGHDHHYERTRPVNGVTYVVTGGGGYSTRAPGAWTEHTAFALDVVHFVHVSIEGETMRVHAIDATGREFDGVEIPMRS